MDTRRFTGGIAVRRAVKPDDAAALIEISNNFVSTAPGARSQTPSGTAVTLPTPMRSAVLLRH